MRRIWCSISSQYFCQHRATNSRVMESGTGPGEVGRSSFIFKGDPFYRSGFLQDPWDYIDSDNLCVYLLLIYICILSCTFPQYNFSQLCLTYSCPLHQLKGFLLWCYRQAPGAQGPYSTLPCYDIAQNGVVPIVILGPQSTEITLNDVTSFWKPLSIFQNESVAY